MSFARTRLTLIAVLVSILSGAPPRAQQDAGREEWQKVEEIFEALDLAEGHQVADVGAGRGFFTFRLAQRVGPTGRVFAVDTSENVVGELAARAKRDAADNVVAIHSTPTDPQLPSSAMDSVLIVNAYHEMSAHRAMLAGIKRALKPGGRLVIVEPRSAGRAQAGRTQQTRHHEIAPALIEADLREAGFEIIDRQDQFTVRPRDGDVESMVVARRPITESN